MKKVILTIVLILTSVSGHAFNKLKCMKINDNDNGPQAILFTQLDTNKPVVSASSLLLVPEDENDRTYETSATCKEVNSEPVMFKSVEKKVTHVCEWFYKGLKFNVQLATLNSGVAYMAFVELSERTRVDKSTFMCD